VCYDVPNSYVSYCRVKGLARGRVRLFIAVGEIGEFERDFDRRLKVTAILSLSGVYLSHRGLDTPRQNDMFPFVLY
jgi:hypothetical protein